MNCFAIPGFYYQGAQSVPTDSILNRGYIDNTMSTDPQPSYECTECGFSVKNDIYSGECPECSGELQEVSPEES